MKRQVFVIYDGYKDRGLSMIWINIVPEENSLIKNWQATHGYEREIQEALK